jgi:MFS family permease
MTLFDQPGLVRYAIAVSLARLADEGGRVVLILLAIDRTGSTPFGGLLVACFLVPHVIAAPVTGALADRSSKRTRTQAIALLSFGICLALVSGLTGKVPSILILLIALIGGCTGPLVTGGMTSLLGLMVPEPLRDRAYGLDIMTYNAAGIVGPAVAVLLAEVFTPSLSMLTLAICTTLGGILVLGLPVNSAGSSHGTSTIRDIVSLDAIRLMTRNLELRTATIVSSIGAAGTAAFPIAAVLLAQETHRGGLAGLCIAASAVGSLIASIVYTRRPFGTAQPLRTAIFCLLAMAGIFAVIPLVEPWYVAVALCGLAGVPASPLASSVFLVRDRESELELRTQIFTLGAGFKMTCSAVGSAIAGVAASAGSGALFAGIAVIQLLSAVIGVLLTHRRNATPVEE